MTSTTFDNWVKGFVEEYLADDDPSGLPTDGEIQAMSDYLKGLTSVEQAAYACTRDIVKPQKGANIWFLIHCTAQELPETQHRLVELVKGISYLPSEMRGEIVWNHGERIKADVACDLRECLDGLVYAITHDPDLRLHQEFINLSAFMARLSDHFTLHVACYAGTALSQALERDYQPHSQLLKTLVRGASEFLEHAAPAVYADYLKYNFQPGELLKMGGGEPAVNRWAFWKRRFEEISNQEGVDHITGEVAKRSAQRMDELG